MGARNIAIVEDDPVQRLVLRGLCEDAGLTVAGEADGVDEAVDICGTLRPDVMLLDVTLKDGDGIEAAARIGRDFPTPVVLLTGLDDPETIRRAIEAGVMAYLMKPVRAEELLPAIEVAVSRFVEFEELKRENEGLKETIETRKAVERAKGLLIEKEGLSEEEAFGRLRKISMDRRKPMRDIADIVISLFG